MTKNLPSGKQIYPAYKAYLQTKNYSPTTIRNYLSDLNQYLGSNSLQDYVKSIKKDVNYPRYISSLNKYFQFCLNQNLIKRNPLKDIDKKPQLDIEILLDQYKNYLIKKHKMPFTIKNYINDIKQFINFCES